MFYKLAVVCLVIGVVSAAKQCSEKNKAKKVNLAGAYGSAEQLTGKALVDHINRLGTWKVCFAHKYFKKMNVRLELLGYLQQTFHSLKTQ